MPTRPTLLLRLPPHIGTGFVDEFSGRADRYRHSTRQNGGFWEATWFFPHDRRRGIDESYLRRWFENYLMHTVDEMSGGVISWQGVIWEMELTLDGKTSRRGIEGMYNRVRSDYTDEAGSTQITSWYDNLESQARYGVRELIVPLSFVSAGEAAAAAQKTLATNGMPYPEVTAVDSNRTEGLEITAAGLIATANNKYVNTTSADGGTGDISAFVSAILTHDCQFLTAGGVQTNTISRKRRFSRVLRAWEGLKELVESGDANGAPWALWVDVDGLAHYAPVDSTPRYYWYGKERGLGSTAGASDPWQARPAVMRDLTMLGGSPTPGDFLLDQRDVWIQEVEMAYGQDRPLLKPEAFDPDAILRAKTQYERWLEREEASNETA